MKRPGWRLAPGLLVLATLLACAAPSVSQRPGGAPSGTAPASMPQRTLVVGFRGEPPSLANKALVVVDGSVRGPMPMFNAGLDGLDERGIGYPHLAQALPELNTESWQLFPDGRMETRFRLRPGLAWHDGIPLSAEDFVFAWRVYATPTFGHATSAPVVYMEEVLAPDPDT